MPVSDRVEAEGLQDEVSASSCTQHFVIYSVMKRVLPEVVEVATLGNT